VACQFGPVAINTASMSAARQQLAQIMVGSAGGIAVLFIGHLLDGLAACGLHVADGHKLHIGLWQKATQVVGSPIADADTAHDDPLHSQADGRWRRGRPW